MHIKLADENKRLIEREVTVTFPGSDARSFSKQKFLAKFKYLTNDEVEEALSRKDSDSGYVKAIVHSVNIELEKEDGTLATPEETLDFAANHPFISAALIGEFNAMRNRNLNFKR